MNVRHTENRNLSVFEGPVFNSFDVYTGSKLILNYLEKIDSVIFNSLTEHPRSLVIRCDLRLPKTSSCPDYPFANESNVISKFVDSFKAKVFADLQKKIKFGTRVHPCSIRYIWTKERKEAETCHYHVALFLNNDTYNSLGDYSYSGKNNATRITEAWASSLSMDFHEAKKLVHFPRNPLYYLNTKSSNFSVVYKQLFYRLSYFAKIETKLYGDGCKNFGCSRR
jgi:hypothetical protein